MKNSILLFTFLLALSGLMLSSCAGAGTDQQAMQEPTTGSQTEEKNTDIDEAKNPTADAKSATATNLASAFTGETTASAKYAAYAKKATEEGLLTIATLFRAASSSENIHANNHRAVLEEMGATVPVVNPNFTVKTTKENLQDAISGESYEISTMYPEFLSIAQKANNQLAMISMNYAFKTEQKHKVLYEKAIAALNNNQVNSLPNQYIICPTCGNTYETTAPKRCGISMTGRERFITITGA
ncbi:MAG: rubrerythrin family protein [Lewinellaceae bacterium]|nr:rubrerythrin family protein [Lewinellaceae bacterium]